MINYAQRTEENFYSSLDRCCKNLLRKFEDSIIHFFSGKFAKKVNHLEITDPFVISSSHNDSISLKIAILSDMSSICLSGHRLEVLGL